MAHSKIGFHVGEAGNHNGLGDWIRRVNDAGHPVGLKSVNNYGRLGEALQIGRDRGVDNWLVFRMTGPPIVSRESPADYTRPPEDDAIELCQEILNKLPPEFDKAVWIEPLNEVRGKVNPGDQMFNDMSATDYMGEWCLAAAKYLNEREYKFCGPSFNSGEPGKEGDLSDAATQYEAPGMLKYLAYCAEHHTEAALSLHEYVWNLFRVEPIEHFYPSLWGRFEAAIAAADKNDIPRTFNIFVTEFGFAFDDTPNLEDARSMLDYRNQMLARWPQVKFDASWALQNYGSAGSAQVFNNVNTWMGYDIGQSFEEGPQPARTHQVFGGTLPGEPSPTEENIRYVNARIGLNLREGPSTDYPIIRALPRGTAVTVLEDMEGWSHVIVGEDKGFVASQYLSATGPVG